MHSLEILSYLVLSNKKRKICYEDKLLAMQNLSFYSIHDIIYISLYQKELYA